MDMKKVFILLILAAFSGSWLEAQEVLTLEECRQLAVEHNKELKISEEKIRIAGNEKKAAMTKYFPQISAEGAYLWNQKDLNLVDMESLGAIGSLLPSGITDLLHLDIQHVWVAGVSLVQPIFMGTKIISYNQIAGYAKDLAESMHRKDLQDLIYKTDETYWQVISLVNKKKLADAYVALLRETDADMTEMVKNGIATEADGLSVKVKLNEAEMAQTKVDNGLALTRMLLAQICGLELSSPMPLADETLDDFSEAGHSLDVDLNTAFENRMELRSLDLVTKIYKKKERIVLSDMLPNVAFTANYLATDPNLFHGFKNEFAGMFNVGVMVKVPISGWWEGSYKRNSAKAETLIRQWQLDDAREKIELQFHQSVYKVNEADKKLAASTKNMEKAEENLRHANLGFEEGVIPALNLMEAQTAWFSARSDLIDAQIEAKLSRVYLNKTVGKLSVSE